MRLQMAQSRTLGTVLIVGLLATASVYAKNKYDKWLQEEVVWIISNDEQEQFKSLKDDSARDDFIDGFWRRRDPTPSTPRNEYKEEHYRRLLFANKMFREGMPGWKTDRGQIYILHGPPAAESFYNSRSTISPTETVPVSARSPNTIVWAYHQNPRARYYKGEIRLVFQPSSGLSRQNFALSDSGLSQQRADELSRRFFPASDPNWLEADVRYKLVMAGPPAIVNAKGAELPSSGMGEFTKYAEDLFRSPGEVLEEREAEIARLEKQKEELRLSARANIAYDQMDLSVRSQAFLQPGGEWLIPVRIELPVPTADQRLDVYVALHDSAGGLFDDFIDSVELDAQILKQTEQKELNYFNTFSAPSGDYQLKVLVRDVASRQSGYSESGLRLDPAVSNKIRMGSLFLTNRVEILPEPEDGEELTEAQAPGNVIIFERTRLLPAFSDTYSTKDFLFVFVQVWLPADSSQVLMTANFIHDGQIVKKLDPRLLKPHESGFLEYGTAVPLADFQAGDYTLQLQALDHSSKTFDIGRASFTIQAPVPESQISSP